VRRRFFHILLVEDDRPTAALLMHLCSCPIPRRLHHVESGPEALDFLHRRGKHSRAPTPDLILLDVNLPCLTGIEVLRIIKSAEPLKVIPCLIVSTSAAPADVNAAYDAGAAAYIQKPENLDHLTRVLECSLLMWLETATLPRPMFRRSAAGGVT
jgi:CheY-like chemotaxis protein